MIVNLSIDKNGLNKDVLVIESVKTNKKVVVVIELSAVKKTEIDMLIASDPQS